MSDGAEEAVLERPTRTFRAALPSPQAVRSADGDKPYSLVVVVVVVVAVVASALGVVAATVSWSLSLPVAALALLVLPSSGAVAIAVLAAALSLSKRRVPSRAVPHVPRPRQWTPGMPAGTR